jgi:hypothetical protein
MMDLIHPPTKVPKPLQASMESKKDQLINPIIGFFIVQLKSSTTLTIGMDYVYDFLNRNYTLQSETSLKECSLIGGNHYMTNGRKSVSYSFGNNLKVAVTKANGS